MSSERLRSREVHRYYQSWLDSSVGFDDSSPTTRSRYHADGSQQKASKDKSLTAFAQLGCLRLNAKRSVVTLISSTEQYILAEATKTLSLLSDEAVEGDDDETWFGNASLPRSEGISGDALSPPVYTAHGCNGYTYTTPALVIDDIAQDKRYCSRAYAGNGVNFYCGVPITTKTGQPIGVYTVTDDKPRHGVTANELKFMSDMAVTVMSHLETVKNEAAKFRGETMVLGLGRFVQGASSLSDDNLGSQISAPYDQPSQSSGQNSSDVRVFKGMHVTAASPQRLRPVMTSSRAIKFKRNRSRSTAVEEMQGTGDKELSLETAPVSHMPDTGNEERQPESPRTNRKAKTLHPGGSSSILEDHTFSRAANIIRECAAADGVLFFDAVSTNLVKRSNSAEFKSQLSQNATDITEKNPQAKCKPDSTTEESSADSSDTEGGNASDSQNRKGRYCEMLGYSMEVSGQSESNVQKLKDLTLPERTLRKLIKRHPEGRIFFFKEDGSISSSDGESTAVSTSDCTSQQGDLRSGKHVISLKIAQDIKSILPMAQIVVWLPLWDFSRQRWGAGCILWSKRAEQLLIAQDDLLYLKTFSHSIMVEIARIDAFMADTAKSTFIANISHELRSPLHGILGSVDILQDTKLDEFQVQLTTAIEACGRTLTDTFEHLLDYAKINQLAMQQQQQIGANRSGIHQTRMQNEDTEKFTLTSEFDLASVVEEVSEVVCSSYTFEKRDRGTKSTELQLESNNVDLSHEATSPDANTAVRVILDIEHQDNWMVRSQVGAIKRIVMNLLTNALKYTDSGIIKMSLATNHNTKAKTTTNMLPITLTVTDTGRGMSTDFMRNHMFTPFRQESQFNSGTGLGLSIVRRILDLLGGKIDLKSTRGVGTEVTISLTLPLASVDSPEPNVFAIHRKELQETHIQTLCLLNPAQEEEPEVQNARKPFNSTFSSMVKSWFGMRTIMANASEDVKADIFVYLTNVSGGEVFDECISVAAAAGAPIMTIAASALENKKLVSTYSEEMSNLGVIIESISDPIGPEKLARILERVIPKIKYFRNRKGAQEEVNANPRHRHLRRQSFAESFERSTPRLAKVARSQTSEELTSSQSAKQDFPQHGIPVFELEKVSKHEISTNDPAASSLSTGSVSPHVLIVDDNSINLNILKAMLKRAKLPFKTAIDGQQAYDTYRAAFAELKQPFTHVLMDINMPVMDGFESTSLIRRFEKSQARSSPSEKSPIDEKHNDYWSLPGKRATIIALSGVASAQAQQDMFNAGIDTFLPKPVNLKNLLKLLKSSDT